MSAAKKYDDQRGHEEQPQQRKPTLAPTPVELLKQRTGFDLKKKLGSGPMNKKMASIGFGIGAYVAFSTPYFDKIPFDKIPFATMFPVPGGPKVLVIGGILAAVGYLLGEVLDPQSK